MSDLELGQLYGLLSIQDTELELLADSMSVRIQTSHGYTCMTFGACVDTDSFMVDVQLNRQAQYDIEYLV